MQDNPVLHPANDKGEHNFLPSRRSCLAKGSFLGRRELSLNAASEQFPIYGADNCVAVYPSRKQARHYGCMQRGQATLNENKPIVFSPMLRKSLEVPREIAFQFWRF